MPFDPGVITSRDQVRAAMMDFVARNRAQKLVVVDLRDDRFALNMLGWNREMLGSALDALATQQRYVRTSDYPVASYGAVVSVWTLAP